MNKYFVFSLAASLILAPLPIHANEFEEEERIEMEQGVNYSGISPEGEKEFWSKENLERLDKKIQNLQEQNAKKTIPYAGNVILNTPRYAQETEYYCVPACAQILIEYVTGNYYTQDALALKMGTTKKGTFMNRAQPVIANLTGANYELGNNSYSHFYANMVADINANYPVIYSVDPLIFGNGHGSY